VVVLMARTGWPGLAARCATLSLLVVLLLAARPSGASAQSVAQLVRSADMSVLTEIDVPAAWSTTMGRGVTVAVLDTGADPTAPDLVGSVTVGPDYIAGIDPAGYQPPLLHGTYISSIIAGHGSGPGRSEGMLGVAPQAQILSVRVIPDDQEPGLAVYNQSPDYGSAVANGINYAVAHGATVINMSLGGGDSRSLRQAIAKAVAHGVVIVASAGNGGTAGAGFTNYGYPASLPGVIAVAAVDASGQRASFSDDNSSVVVAAPGVNVDGAIAGGQYVQASGTSPASAFVAGIAALIRSAYPRLTPVQVMQAIVTSTTDRPPGGYSPAVGFGEVDADAALTAAGTLAHTPATRGLAGTAHFGPRLRGPIVVVPKDPTRIAVEAAVALAAVLGFLATAVALIATARRRRRAVADLTVEGPA
jgi:type VII secretion-associated serine protease mycosin